MRKFKAESKKVLDIMINSIYTNKEIFLRELLSNASDAIDKLYFKSLQTGATGLTRSDFFIEIAIDRENRVIKITDNGIGMTESELENNLGVIAKSGSLDFKSNNELKDEDINIIGQFGVGFYSAFMVSDRVEVLSKAYGENKAYLWSSNGAEGYEICEAEKQNHGTQITLYIKNDDENEDYSKFLEEYTLKNLVTKYSNYIFYPIKMLCTKYDYSEGDEQPKQTKEMQTLNSMQPIWKKAKTEITEEEYNDFYKNTFYDAENPLRVIHSSMEGAIEFKTLLYIPSHAPQNYFTKEYESGLKLYTNGVMITEKCKDLIPDHFSFVKGVVDTDVQLNISRETVQQSKSLKLIANNIEKKIKKELESMLETDREGYEKFFGAFGAQLKFGIYRTFGMNKDLLQDLLLFYSVKQGKYLTLKEYVNLMGEEQKFIYYATGKTVDSIKLLPQISLVTEHGFDVLCMTEEVDEFTVKSISEYAEKQFKNVCSDDLGIEESDDENFKELSDCVKEILGDRVERVRISNRIKNHPVCFTVTGEVSLEMERVLNSLPNSNNQIKAKRILEINSQSGICNKLSALFESDKDKLNDIVEVLYDLANLIEGIAVKNPVELTDKICKLLTE